MTRASGLINGSARSRGHFREPYVAQVLVQVMTRVELDALAELDRVSQAIPGDGPALGDVSYDLGVVFCVNPRLWITWRRESKAGVGDRRGAPPRDSTGRDQ